MVMVLKTFAGSIANLWEKDQLQLFDLQDKDKSRKILIENGCVILSPLHFYGRHNGEGTRINGSSA
jgi:hypothetical protein